MDDRPTKLASAHLWTLRKSGIQSAFRFYNLGHTCGGAGIGKFTLTILMGYTELSTTQRCIHLSKAHLEDAHKRRERFRSRRWSI
jgi:site-specific recombinase XerD